MDIVEKLQRENSELRQELEKSQTTLHYTLKDIGSLHHRGSFHNCPEPGCVYARILLGKVMTDEHKA